jgi:hypothetical protein
MWTRPGCIAALRILLIRYVSTLGKRQLEQSAISKVWILRNGWVVIVFVRLRQRETERNVGDCKLIHRAEKDMLDVCRKAKDDCKCAVACRGHIEDTTEPHHREAKVLEGTRYVFNDLLHLGDL